MAAEQGFEPWQTVPETAVLPLHHSAKREKSYLLKKIRQAHRIKKYKPGHNMAQEKRLILKDLDTKGYNNSLSCYLKHGGYETLKKAFARTEQTTADGKKVSPQEQLRNEVKISGLRGRGGAGFPTGIKWSFINHNCEKPIYLVCNCDESEPGTFKDRQIVHKDPHQLIEGIILACYANDVHQAYIYMRGEFVQGAQIMNNALAETRKANFLGKNILKSGYDLEIYLHRGAGAYICGEETGAISSLEGRRPSPRIKPPYFPAVLGLYMCPTIVNNVETLCAVRHVLEMGGAEYAKLGVPEDPGTRVIGVSGMVQKPGYFEIEIGKLTLGEIINDLAGGIRPGHKLKAIVPGGSSAKVLRADEKIKLKQKNADGTETVKEVGVLDLPYDSTHIGAAGSMTGSGGIIVMDETVNMVEMADNVNTFYMHESCGQCTPCREGNVWINKILKRLLSGEGRRIDADEILRICHNIMGGKTVCAFGEGSTWPIESYVLKFREEFLALGAKAEDTRKEVWGEAGINNVNQYEG